jgi:hypothetical protein
MDKKELKWEQEIQDYFVTPKPDFSEEYWKAYWQFLIYYDHKI